MSEISEIELQDLRERWEATKTAMEIAWGAIVETLSPAFEVIKQLVSYFAEMVQRAYLCHLLPRWMSEGVRAWLARNWPSSLLPQLSDAIEWMKTAAEAAEAAEFAPGMLVDRGQDEEGNAQ